MTDETRTCKSCGREKPARQFRPRGRGRSRVCDPCLDAEERDAEFQRPSPAGMPDARIASKKGRRNVGPDLHPTALVTSAPRVTTSSRPVTSARVRLVVECSECGPAHEDEHVVFDGHDLGSAADAVFGALHERCGGTVSSHVAPSV